MPVKFIVTEGTLTDCKESINLLKNLDAKLLFADRAYDTNEILSYIAKREWQLTGISIFGMIASAVVLTIYFLEIYAATWFFWFGIVGVILTVTVGIRLFFCLKKNLNDLRKLENNLQKKGKTIPDKIAEINRAIDVYDSEKIRNFQEPKMKTILTFDKNENKTILSDDEINATEQNYAPRYCLQEKNLKE